MAQTLAVLPRFAVGPLPQAPEKAMKKQAANDEDQFAGWLGETGRDESSAVRERDASGGTAGALYGIARQGAGRAKFSTGEAVDTPASKSSTEPPRHGCTAGNAVTDSRYSRACSVSGGSGCTSVHGFRGRNKRSRAAFFGPAKFSFSWRCESGERGRRRRGHAADPLL